MTSLSRSVRRARAQQRAGLPVALAVAGIVLLATALSAALGVQVKTYALDETLFHASAMRYTQGFPDTLLHDPGARATSRLYSLLLMPLAKVFAGGTAIQAMKVWSALMFASAAIPAYLLAARVLAGTRGRLAVAALSVLVPWLTLSTALFSEALAYPVFLWLCLAAVAALQDPRPWRDLAVMVAFAVAVTSRVQLGFAFPGWVLAVVLIGLRRPALGRRPVNYLRRLPLTTVIVALVVLAALAVLVSGRALSSLRSGLGGYSATAGTSIPVDLGLALLQQIELIGLGIGVLPLVVGVAWYGRTLVQRGSRGRDVALVTLLLVASLLALTFAAQNGFVGPLTEERYYFYAAPLLWIGTFAALEGRRRPGHVTGHDLALGSVVVVVLFATLLLPRTLADDTTFLAPASALVNRLALMVIGIVAHLGNPLSSRDVVWPVAAVALVLLGLAWRRGESRGLGVLLGLAAAFQVGLLLYALGAGAGFLAAGTADRTAGPSFRQLGWVDRLAGDRGVQWLATEPRALTDVVAGDQRTIPFWNGRVRSRTIVAGLPPLGDAFPLDALTTGLAARDLRTGALGSRPTLVVQWRGSPLAQVAGQVLGRSPDGLYELVDPGRATRLSFYAEGLDALGGIDRPSRLYAFPGRPATLRLQFAGTPGADAGQQDAVRVRGGGPTGRSSREARITVGGPPTSVDVPLCDARDVVALDPTDTSEVGGRTIAGLLTSATLGPATPGAC